MKPITIIYKIFAIAGIILILIGIGVSIRSVLFICHNNDTIGTVIEIIQAEDSDGTNKDVLYGNKVQFLSSDGKSQIFISKAWSRPPKYSLGDSVHVLYNPSNPQNAEIKSFETLWMPQITLFFMGLMFISISFFNLKSLHSKKPLGVSYSIELSGKEMSYAFLKKKFCPKCNGKLVRHKKYSDCGVGKSDGIDRFSLMYGKRYNVTLDYKCNTCGETFTLKQLIKS